MASYYISSVVRGEIIVQDICLICNSSWNLYNYRLELIKDLTKHYNVYIISPKDKYSFFFRDIGCEYIELNTYNNSFSIFKNLKFLLDFFCILNKFNFKFALTYSTKINLLTPLLLKLKSVKIMMNVTGLGILFTKGNFISFIFKLFYKFNLLLSDIKVFQSHSDQKFFFNNTDIISSKNNFIVPGSGTKIISNLKILSKKNLEFIFVGRLLKIKGILDFVNVAIKVKKIYPKIKFTIAGAMENNHNYIDMIYLKNCVDKKIVNYIGFTDNIDEVLSNSDCIIFPSIYYEGIPHSLIKAASLGNIIITYDWRGCSETVNNNKNGFLIPVDKNKETNLFKKVLKIIKMDSIERIKMKQASYEIAKSKFDYRLVNDKIIFCLNNY